MPLAGEPDRSEVRPTLRWRKTDSNSRSLRKRERPGGATPGKHWRLGPEPVSGSAFGAAVSDWQRPEEPFAGAGPKVRIRFPPAKSHLRTRFATQRNTADAIGHRRGWMRVSPARWRVSTGNLSEAFRGNPVGRPCRGRGIAVIRRCYGDRPSTTCGGPCRSRYDPPGRSVPTRSANERDARKPVSRS